MVEEKRRFYCRYEGENSQRHLEGSRMNQPMIGERRGRAKENEKRERSVERTTWEPGDQEGSSQKWNG